MPSRFSSASSPMPDSMSVRGVLNAPIESTISRDAFTLIVLPRHSNSTPTACFATIFTRWTVAAVRTVRLAWSITG